MRTIKYGMQISIRKKKTTNLVSTNYPPFYSHGNPPFSQMTKTPPNKREKKKPSPIAKNLHEISISRKINTLIQRGLAQISIYEIVIDSLPSLAAAAAAAAASARAAKLKESIPIRPGAL